MRNKLSAVVITRDEEGKIASCLESIRWADEVIIIDGYSTDRTVEICKKFGAKVIQRQAEDDLGLKRNIGTDAASGDWILQLDADEIVTDALAVAITKMLNSPGPYVAFKCRRKNYFLGHFMRYGGWYHYSTNLFKKGFARYDGRVHHVLKVNGKVGILEEAVEHYPFQSFEQFIDRQNRYTSLEAGEMLEKEGMLDLRMIRHNLMIRPLKLFWKMYVKKMGFREGMLGLIFSVLYAWVHFIKWAKYWERLRTPYEDHLS